MVWQVLDEEEMKGAEGGVRPWRVVYAFVFESLRSRDMKLCDTALYAPLLQG